MLWYFDRRAQGVMALLTFFMTFSKGELGNTSLLSAEHKDKRWLRPVHIKQSGGTGRRQEKLTGIRAHLHPTEQHLQGRGKEIKKPFVLSGKGSRSVIKSGRFFFATGQDYIWKTTNPTETNTSKHNNDFLRTTSNREKQNFCSQVFHAIFKTYLLLQQDVTISMKPRQHNLSILSRSIFVPPKCWRIQACHFSWKMMF